MKTVDIRIGVLLYFLNLGAVAQLVRASDCRSEGCGFESHRPRHFRLSRVRVSHIILSVSV